VPSPNGSTVTDGSSFDGVSCTAASFCMAVGSLSSLWGGGKWSIPPSPNKPSVGYSLYGVSCTSPSSCTAVGATGTLGKTLVESWDGTRWSVVPSPSPPAPGGGGDEFRGVSCASAHSCTAIGHTGAWGSGPTESLVASWHGTGWSVSKSPNAGSLYGVSCSSAETCAAVASSGRILAEKP
jgi:hypothetical protein